jgi:hypothetical protein
LTRGARRGEWRTAPSARRAKKRHPVFRKSGAQNKSLGHRRDFRIAPEGLRC